LTKAAELVWVYCLSANTLNVPPYLLNRQLESSNHTGRHSRASTATFSFDNSSSTMDSLVEDLSSLHELFRERCTSSDTARVSALMCWEAAYGGDNDHQPDLDDMSVVSSESFLGPQQTIDDNASDNGLDGGTRHTALSMDSE
jgi:hypothetical protein